jgi:hypothetical protein
VRKLLPYTTLAVILAAIYSGWTLYSRYQSAREADQRVHDTQTQKSASQAQTVIDEYGGGKLAILSFHVEPQVASAGERVLVCYGVANATEVTIEPRIEDVKPSVSRCLEVHPTTSVTYTLTARDGSGASQMQTARVEIR